MDTNPYIDAFLKSVNVFGLRVIAPTTRIFFCGGPYDPKFKLPLQSARDYILRIAFTKYSALSDRFYYEEDMSEWLHGGHFTDLHSFEKHIAELSSVVFLVAESPGSYAELGAFVNSPSILRKMFVVTNTATDDDNSYISLGPLSFLKNISSDKVRTYPWTSKFETGQRPTAKESDLLSIVHHIIDELLKFEKKISGEQIFEKDIDGHVSLFIIDYIRLYGACKFREIVTDISNLFGPFQQADIRRHLFLLEKLELIEKRQHGGTYYVAKSSANHIAYGFRGGTGREIADRARLTMDVRLWFKENDPLRFAVIRTHGVDGHE